MLGSWLFYVAVAVPTLLAAVLATKGGRRRLKRARRRVFRRAWRDTGTAVQASRKARAATPRGRIRAKRRRQPKRLTFGHRRRADDPHPARVAARKTKSGTARLVEKAKVARANRKAQQRRPLELLPATPRAKSAGLCGWRETTTGHPCKNRRMVGDRYCHKHTPQVIA